MALERSLLEKLRITRSVSVNLPEVSVFLLYIVSLREPEGVARVGSPCFRLACVYSREIAISDFSFREYSRKPWERFSTCTVLVRIYYLRGRRPYVSDF